MTAAKNRGYSPLGMPLANIFEHESPRAAFRSEISTDHETLSFEGCRRSAFDDAAGIVRNGLFRQRGGGRVLGQLLQIELLRLRLYRCHHGRRKLGLKGSGRQVGARCQA
jgi:hypothetical protein